MCGKNSTTTQTNQPSQQQQDAYKYVTNVAQQTAALPYQEYTGPRVAGFTPDQQAGFSAVQNAQGISTPYLNTAAQYQAQSAAPITPQAFSQQALEQYQNPYTQDVVNATMAQLNQSNRSAQNDLLGKAISSGASPFGGDRAGIAAAQLAGQQSLATGSTLANLNNAAYNNALSAFQQQQGVNLGAAQNDAQRAAAAGTAFANLGNQAQQNALTGASALLQTGGLQQQQGQQQLDIPYQNFQAEQQYPRDVANWLVNAINSNPTSLGSTTSTTSPTASPLNSLLGLGLGIAGLPSSSILGGALGLRRGGRALSPIHIGMPGKIPDKTGTSEGYLPDPISVEGFDDGGQVGGIVDPRFTWAAPTGYGIDIPMLKQSVFQFAPVSSGIWPGTATGTGTAPVSSIPSYINALPQISQDAMPAPKTVQLPASLLSAIQNVPKSLQVSKKDGGGIEGYADGGQTDAPFNMTPLGPIDPVVAAGLSSAAVGTPSGIAPPASPPSVFPTESAGIAPHKAGAPRAQEPGASPQLDAHPVVDSSGGTLSVHYPSEGQTINTGIPSATAEYLRSPRSALLDAGAAMMASTSPNPLVAMGQGLQAGLQGWQQRLQAANEMALKEQELQQQKEIAFKPEVTQTGYSGFYPTYGIFDPATQKITPVSPQEAGTGTDSGLSAMADGIRSGQVPPPSIGSRPTKYTMALTAALEKPTPEFPNGFNLSKAVLDWNATTRYVNSLNNNQMLTLRNAISQVDQSINMLAALNDRWQAGKFPPMNSIRGDAAKLGALGPEAQSIYTQMEAQIADVTSEMGSVLMKGNSPTDHGLELAAKNLNINSPYETFVDSLAQLRENISYKRNSMMLGPAGVEANSNPYAANLPATPPPTDAVTSPNIANPGSAKPPPSPTAAPSAAPSSQSAPSTIPHISGDEEYNALPPGASFIGPDGITRRKP